uniref:Uncharacterized LOC105937759 n=1 Tax=Fundulus heteroclitus TaxID=8078 RepID=A0A3Q2TGE0_FUNHE
MGRKCSVVGCSSYGGLHIFPQDVNIRRQWLRLIGLWDDFELPPKAGVCKLHFRRDSFANLMAFEEGFAKKLLLKSDEVPALALPLRRSGVERQRPPTLLPRQHKDLEHKLEPKVTKEIGCQTDPVISRHACIQANLKPSEGTEEITPEISPQKRKEGEASASELCLDVNDSASAVSCSSALSDVPPYKQKKYIVYEDQLLKIFQSCPVCTNRCTVDTITTGTLLRVSLLCPRCEYCSQWSSQPTENGIPLGNLQLCAAVLFTGSSFHQISKFLGAFNIQGLSKQGFYRYQAKLLRNPTVSWQRGLEQDELFQETNDGRSVTPDGNMYADSPGEASLERQNPDFVPSVVVHTENSQRFEAKAERYNRKRKRDDGLNKPPDQPNSCDTPELQEESSMEQCPDVLQLLVIKEDPPAEEQNQSPRPDQEDQKPPQIKKEQEDTEIKQWIFNPVSVKSENDEEKPRLPELLHSIKIQRNGDSF